MSSPQPEKIHAMFSEIAPGYDRANQILSFGIHHLWRREVVRRSGAKTGDHVLDCATGTGDLALEFKRRVGPTGTVLGTDFCAEMLIPAPVKARKLGLEVKFETADVLNLPYESASFDISSIAFGIRNVADPKRGLSELARVTRSGGRVMVLEFGQPNIPVIGPAYRWYSRHVLPKIGGLITGKPDAYSYLENSSSQFPCRNEFLELMRSTGRFGSVEYKTLSCGIAFMYRGIVT